MPQTLSKNIVPLVFSTKNRAATIAPPVRDELAAYMVGILEKRDCYAIIIRAVADHVHLLFVLSRNHALAKIVSDVKAVSSKWVKSTGLGMDMFAWQSGYGAFSVSTSNIEGVKNYIAGQEEHHKKVSFQEELRKLLEKNQIDYDERWLWD